MTYAALQATISSSGSAISTNWSDYKAADNVGPAVFNNSATTTEIAIAAIDTSRTIIAYKGTSGQCRAKIVQFDMVGTPTVGTEAVIVAATSSKTAVAVLDSTHAIIACNTGGAVKCSAISFSGTTISTVGTAVSTETVNPLTGSIKIAQLSSSDFFVTYIDNTNNLARIYYGSVSGTTITMGSGISLNTSTLNTFFSTCIARLTNAQAIVGVAGGNADHLDAYLVSVSGTSPSKDYTLTILSSNAYTPNKLSCVPLSSTQMIMSYTETNTLNQSYSTVVTNTSGTLTNTTPVVFYNNTLTDTATTLPDSGHVVIAGNRSGTTIKTVVETVSGTTLTPLTVYDALTSGNIAFLCGASVGAGLVVLAYEDLNNSNFGTLLILRP